MVWYQEAPWDLVTTFNWAYSPTYNPPKWAYRGYPDYKEVGFYSQLEVVTKSHRPPRKIWMCIRKLQIQTHVHLLQEWGPSDTKQAHKASLQVS